MCGRATFQKDQHNNYKIYDENDETEDSLQPAIMTVEVEIAAVLNNTNYLSCVSCKESVHPINATLGVLVPSLSSRQSHWHPLSICECSERSVSFFTKSLFLPSSRGADKCVEIFSLYNKPKREPV